MVPLSLLQEAGVAFSLILIFTMRTWSSSCSKSHRIVGPALHWVPSGLFNSDLSTLSLQQFLNYNFYFPAAAPFPLAVSASESLYAGKLLFSLFACWFLQFWGFHLPCILNCLKAPIGVVDGFTLFSFLFVIRIEWWFLSFLHGEPEVSQHFYSWSAMEFQIAF